MSSQNTPNTKAKIACQIYFRRISDIFKVNVFSCPIEGNLCLMPL
jgi:hypothetical protein